jgi:phosphocarrier protein FPr
VVGLVLVSHSRPLADALLPFLRDMSGEAVRIEIAAGTGDPDAEYGTDATAIASAIEVADDGDGVVVLLDVGSAVLSADTALEFIDPDLRERTRLVDAPFVEGAISAGVTASGGGSLDQVVRDARAALDQKRQALPGDMPASPSETSATATDPGVWDATTTVEVVNDHGLHARPAARFVRLALEYTGASDGATVQVRDLTNGNGPVDATSQSTVTTLGAVRGHRLQIDATGDNASNIVERLASLVASGFEDEDEPPSVSTDGTSPIPSATGAVPGQRADSPYTDTQMERALRGIAVQPGAAVAPAYVHQPAMPEIPDETTDDPEATWDRLSTVLDHVQGQMDNQRSRLIDTGHTDAADILGAQQLLLADPALRDRVRSSVFEDRHAAPGAWMNGVEAVIEAYASADDAYLSQRADDVRDVAVRVLHVLVDVPQEPIRGPETPHILISRRFRPSDIPELDGENVQAVVCAEGNATSHSAILLRGRGIAAVFDAGPDLLTVNNGDDIAVDALQGLVWMDPEDDVRDAVETVRREHAEAGRRARAAAHDPATTASGTEISVGANVSGPDDAKEASENGADGVGLLRTEFLFRDRTDAPDEDEQVSLLDRICTAVSPGTVTVRTLDVGGDKPLRYLPLPEEANPALGLRGIRALLREPELLRRQLRAVLRVADRHPVRLMVPMVATLEEIQKTRTLLDEARDQIRQSGGNGDAPLPLGTMIETPAAALTAHVLAEELDFFSIGTNDLTQYTMAADREHGDLAALTDALQPAVLRLIRDTAAAAREASIPVSVCGEMAADRLAVPILLGLGIRSLSVLPNRVPSVKALVRSLNDTECADLADEVLGASSAADVRRRVRDILPKETA